MSRSLDAQVAVIGGGVVGAAITHALAGRGVSAVLLEAEAELATAASGSNSGILHTGFDSAPGELETELILRSVVLRDRMIERLGVPVIPCGGVVRPRTDAEAAVVSRLAANAKANGVAAAVTADGALEVPGEAVTDPVAYTVALASTAAAVGARIRRGARVEAIERDAAALTLRIAEGDAVTCAAAVNCAGLRADEVARLVDDRSFTIYPRKGEFFVFDPPEPDSLDRILLPVPSRRTKGVLVFPTVDGKLVAGPTAHDQDDKDDWAVREEAFAELMPKARAMLPALEGAEPIASYAGLRPAGCDCNYVIAPSPACPRLINVAAIRSTGLSASLGIAERVVELVGEAGLGVGEPRELPAAEPSGDEGDPWWRRAGRRESVA
jgi:glycerol-3-phosphate dehydrogenase